MLVVGRGARGAVKDHRRQDLCTRGWLQARNKLSADNYLELSVYSELPDLRAVREVKSPLEAVVNFWP